MTNSRDGKLGLSGRMRSNILARAPDAPHARASEGKGNNMSKLSALALMMILGAASAAACGGSSEKDSDGDDGTVPSGGSKHNDPPTGGNDNGSGGKSNDNTGGTAGETGTEDDSPPKILRGADLELPGTGACEGVSLGEFIERAHELRPELADIEALTPGSGEVLADPGREIIPLQSDDGFLLAFKRGDGDCEAGCISSTYFYFESDEECQPVYLGKYSAIYDSENKCYEVEGERRWDVGRNVPTTSRCDYEPYAADVSGSHEVSAEGSIVPCSTESGEEEAWEEALEFVVEQDPSDPTKAEVSFKNVHPKVDAGSWPATVEADVLSVDFERSKSSCIDSVAVDFSYDFAEGKGSFTVDIAGVTDCSDPGSELCKGHISLTLKN